ncbi:MAG TPA: MFS transporter [Pseudoneobacillus sp.]|nr:MFS transporter [Pseudoneobacillus sp.]
MSIKEYRKIFGNRVYKRLFFAQLTSQLGSVIGVIAFTFYILDRFSSQPIFATLTEMMYALPMLFVFFLTGVFADKFDRQKIALYSDWICSLLSIMLLLFIWIDILPLVYLTIFLRSGVGKFFQPAQSSLVHGILSKEDYPIAMGMNSLLMSIFIIAGNGIGAFVYWWVGISGAILIDALSYLVSGILIGKIAINNELRKPNGEFKLKDINVRMIINDFHLGIQYVLQQRVIFSLLLGIIFLGVINGGLTVMNIFIMKYKLAPETYEQTQILLSCVSGTSVLISSLCAVFLTKKFPYYKLIIASFILPGIVFILEAQVTNPLLFMLFHFIFAFTVPIFNVAFSGWLGSVVDQRMMGRVQGLIAPLSLITMTLTQGFIAFAFPKYISVEIIFYIVGSAALILGLYYITKLPRLAKLEEVKQIGSVDANVI